jgi:hypothetical protein
MWPVAWCSANGWQFLQCFNQEVFHLCLSKLWQIMLLLWPLLAVCTKPAAQPQVRKQMLKCFLTVHTACSNISMPGTCQGFWDAPRCLASRYSFLVFWLIFAWLASWLQTDVKSNSCTIVSDQCCGRTAFSRVKVNSGQIMPSPLTAAFPGAALLWLQLLVLSCCAQGCGEDRMRVGRWRRGSGFNHQLQLYALARFFPVWARLSVTSCGKLIPHRSFVWRRGFWGSYLVVLNPQPFYQITFPSFIIFRAALNLSRISCFFMVLRLWKVMADWWPLWHPVLFSMSMKTLSSVSWLARKSEERSIP